MLSNRKIEIDVQQNVSKPVIYEQNEWVRSKLSEIWGDNKADYFVNPDRAPRKSSQDARNDDDTHRNLSNPKNRGSRTGLYAYMIWDNIREDADNKFKVYSLDKDLHSLNYYERVKEKVAEDIASSILNKKSKKKQLNKENQISKLNNTYADTSRMKENNVYRSEIELMYRSSKMNEVKVNVMRANVPLPDINDAEGKDSIVRYLPPIANLNNEMRALTRNQYSSLDFVTSPVLRRKCKKRMEQNLLTKVDTPTFNLIDTSAKNDKNNKLKMEIQNVKLHFLTERPAREYKGQNKVAAELNDTTQSLSLENNSNSDDVSQLRIEDVKADRIYADNYADKMKAIVPYDSKAVSYPPLSMNALMEYKPLIKAPGTGEFDNGKPKLFKL